jgi:outer membrane lipoprotein-sorting protein
MRSSFARLSLTVFVVAFCGAATTTAWAQSTAEIFSRLDHAAQSFTGATARIQVITHTEIINENEKQIGTIAVKRHTPDEMHFLINFTGPAAQGIALRGQTLQIYYPKLNTVREYDIGKYKDLAQKLILLGFGMPGRELAANYDVSSLGGERVQSEDSVHFATDTKGVGSFEAVKQGRFVDFAKDQLPSPTEVLYAEWRLSARQVLGVKVNGPVPACALDLPKAAKRERMN